SGCAGVFFFFGLIFLWIRSPIKGADMEPNGFRAVRSQDAAIRFGQASAPGLADPSLGTILGAFSLFGSFHEAKQSDALRGSLPAHALMSDIQIKLSRLQMASTML